MIERMLAFGEFQFSLDTAAYEALSRRTEARFARHAIVGGDEVVQFTGLPSETITLEGRIYPHFRGGLGQLDTLRALVRSGEPRVLADLDGFVRGMWVATSVEERQTHLDGSGRPHRQDFRFGLLSHTPEQQPQRAAS